MKKYEKLQKTMQTEKQKDCHLGGGDNEITLTSQKK